MTSAPVVVHRPSLSGGRRSAGGSGSSAAVAAVSALARLDELEKDLLARRDKAEREGWAGEIEGLNLTLALLRSKRDESQRMARRPAVDLGIPARRRPKESE
ncbi:hypothetical protein ACFTXM_23345 [Streptomyces sp. NPDC056930]|uniref:hypothetical protein n=1 Tax=Streptomyces sp. NPDC056930 TaxID=3345967 RepID=UPI00362FFD8E